MKRIMTLLILGGIIVSSGVVFAGHETGRACNIKQMSISEALKKNDDEKVTIKGNIVNKISSDKYTFKDSTGSMVVDIDNDKWSGISSDTKDMLELTGEIERKNNSVELDVDMVKKVSNN